jgi:hypothetical protein
MIGRSPLFKGQIAAVMMIIMPVLLGVIGTGGAAEGSR